MTKASYAFSAFTAGEGSPRLAGRFDLSKYFSMCSTLENFTVMPHGGVNRRSGTQYVAEVKSSAASTRIIGFEFSTEQTYILEFGNQYIRFYKSGAQIRETAKNITAITKANPAVVTSSSHGFLNGEEVYISGVVGMVEVNNKAFKVADKTTNTFELQDMSSTDVNSSSYTTYASGGTAERVYTVTSPYLTAELFELQVAQSNDVMYIVHPNHAPRKLTRTGHTAWTLTEVAFELGPMMDENDTTTTLTSNGLTSSVTITASAVTGINDGAGFQTNDVGRLVKLFDGYAKITARNSTTEVVATVQTNADLRDELLPAYTASTISFKEGDPDSTNLEHNDRILDSDKKFIDEGFKVGQKITISGTSSNNKTCLIVAVTADTILVSPSDDLADEAASSGNTLTGTIEPSEEWSLGAFSPQTGFPSSVCFYEERLVLAGTTEEPQTLFFSESGGFEQFKEGSSDSDAMRYTIASQQVNIIRYLQPLRVLVVGTSGGEFAASASASGEPLTPTNVQIKRQTTYGASKVSPIQSGNAVLFLQRAKRKIRELVYNFDVDGYIAPDMTILAEHISEGGFDDMDIQQEPDNIIWAVRADGQLCGLTYRREEQVVAWHRHKLGGSFTGVHGTAASATYDHGIVESVASIPGDLDEDDVYVVVKRTVNSATKRYIEKLAPLNFGSDVADAIFVDSSLSYTGASNTLNGAINTTATTITLTSSSDFSASGAVKIGQEIISYTGNSSNQLTGCTRTVAGLNASHADDATVTQAVNSFSNLHHLEGQTVSILADGAAHPDATVSSGAITLSRYATKAHVGLNYQSTLKTMRIEAGSADGTAQGKVKRLHHATVRLYRSVGVKVGESATVNDLIPFRSSADRMDQPISLFSGDKQIEFDSGFDTDGFVTVIQDQPLPLTLLGIYIRLQTFDT